eukprot:TRINITY_DN5584_c0_g2_i1.p1 TRINITY_DN5584_c0_g2~~TRINITY_DN5584_c0_g2_i1.p1  ORF type:complete len:450 (-),score=63.70 TRINITY_DN5584_c0_g2_i1:56-1405(-)
MINDHSPSYPSLTSDSVLNTTPNYRNSWSNTDHSAPPKWNFSRRKTIPFSEFNHSSDVSDDTNTDLQNHDNAQSMRYVNAYLPNLGRPPTSSPVFRKKKSPPSEENPPLPPEETWPLPPVSPKRVPDIEKELNAQNLYKTELCRPFEETGACRYGSKCQFAHGLPELRPILRHPKYKTEICKTFHNLGTCPYGARCRFIHRSSPEEIGANSIFIPPPVVNPYRNLSPLWRDVVQKKSSQYMSSCVDSDHEEEDSSTNSPDQISLPQTKQSTQSLLPLVGIPITKDSSSGGEPELRVKWDDEVVDKDQEVTVPRGEDSEVPEEKLLSGWAQGSPASSLRGSSGGWSASQHRVPSERNDELDDVPLEVLELDHLEPLEHLAKNIPRLDLGNNVVGEGKTEDSKNGGMRRRGSSGSRLPVFQRLAEDTEEGLDEHNLAGSMKEDSQYLVDSH